MAINDAASVMKIHRNKKCSQWYCKDNSKEKSVSIRKMSSHYHLFLRSSKWNNTVHSETPEATTRFYDEFNNAVSSLDKIH